MKKEEGEEEECGVVWSLRMRCGGEKNVTRVKY
jgi:hypothetical protein